MLIFNFIQKQKKQILIAVVLIFLITLGLIYALHKFANVDKPQTSIPSYNPTIKIQPESDPIDNMEEFVSDVVTDFSELSPEEKCKQTEGKDAQLNCYDNLILKEVIASKILLACDDLKFLPNKQYCQDVFYKNKALMDMDSNLCEKIKDDYLRKQCIDSVLLRNSIKAGSLEDCNQITDLKQKNNCIDKVALKEAITNADISQCDLLEEESLRDLCRSKGLKQSEEKNYTQALETQNVTLCASLSDGQDQKCQDAVNYEISLTNNDVSQCSQILSQEKQLDCINKVSLNLAKTNLKPQHCLKIQEDSTKANCLREVNAMLLKLAITTNESNQCNLITDENLVQKCLQSF